jgi:hypothetical protein
MSFVFCNMFLVLCLVLDCNWPSLAAVMHTNEGNELTVFNITGKNYKGTKGFGRLLEHKTTILKWILPCST